MRCTSAPRRSGSTSSNTLYMRRATPARSPAARAASRPAVSGRRRMRFISLVLVLLPGTQGLYGFIVTVMMLMNIGVLGGSADMSLTKGLLYLTASLPIAVGGLLSGIAQGRAAVSGISLMAQKPNDFSKALVSTTLVEIYALLAFLVSLLSVINIAGMTNI